MGGVGGSNIVGGGPVGERIAVADRAISPLPLFCCPAWPQKFRNSRFLSNDARVKSIPKKSSLSGLKGKPRISALGYIIISNVEI